VASVQLLPAADGAAVSYLVYCILDGGRREPRGKVRFLGYPRASIMVRAGGLGAVVSRTSPADAAADVARLLVYSKIVEWYNREQTVIPMRYGCTLAGLTEVARFLEAHKGDYLRLLAELDGRVEMSARVSIEDSGGAESSNPRTESSASFARGGAAGISYLARRSRYYALREASERRREELSKRICTMADGTFVRSTSEYDRRDGENVLCLHFLVPRGQVETFTRALRPLRATVKGSLAVTGPWPPYNFVRRPASAP
jgi:gas vesicle protein GvpL/GvpF